jgi:hypothetical protein
MEKNIKKIYDMTRVEFVKDCEYALEDIRKFIEEFEDDFSDSFLFKNGKLYELCDISWNILMPVVNFINKWNISIRPFNGKVPENMNLSIKAKKVKLVGMIWSSDDKDKGEWIYINKSYKSSNKLKSTYESVIDFIEWYNLNK